MRRRILGGGGAYLPADLIPLDDTRYLQALESVVRELAKGPSLVIRGRGSQFILKDHPGSLHVLVVAPYEIRVGRVMHDRGLGTQAAGEEIRRFDSSRHEFAKRYFRAHLEDPYTTTWLSIREVFPSRPPLPSPSTLFVRRGEKAAREAGSARRRKMEL